MDHGYPCVELKFRKLVEFQKRGSPHEHPCVELKFKKLVEF